MAKALPDLSKETFGLAAAAEKPAPRKKYSSGLAQLNEALKQGFGAGGSANGGYSAYIEGLRYPVGARVAMPLAMVVENPTQPRVYFDPADQAELEASVAAIGQQEAAKVFFDERIGKYVLKGGHRRYRALTSLGHPTILVEVVEHKEGLQFYREARDLNMQARGHHHLDDAVRFPQLLKAHRMDGRSLAKALGMSESEVSKRVKIGTLPRAVLDELAETVSSFGVDACYWLAVIADRFQERGLELVHKLIPQIRARRVSNRRLQELAKGPQANADTGEHSKRQLPERRCELKGVGSVMKAFSNRIEFRLVDVDQAVRDQLFSKLEEFFKAEGLLGGAGAPVDNAPAVATSAPVSRSANQARKAGRAIEKGAARPGRRAAFAK